MGKETFRERYPMAAVSLSEAGMAELKTAALARGFKSRRGPRVGGFLGAMLEGLWPFLRAVEFDPSRCDISPEHAWLLGELRMARASDPERWARALDAAAEALGTEMPTPALEAVAKAREDAHVGRRQRRHCELGLGAARLAQLPRGGAAGALAPGAGLPLAAPER